MMICGDALTELEKMASDSVDCCVTSPPYWGLRDYGVEGQIGLESDFFEYLRKLVRIFEEVRRVLKPEGTCWVNMGDAYNTGTNKGRRYSATNNKDHGYWNSPHDDVRINFQGLKPKDLIGQPWRLAFAMQEKGWYLRSDIIWNKPNPMPESVTDRPTKAHEYIFLFSKSNRYYYDAKAIEEKSVTDDMRRPYGSQGSWDLDGRPIEQRPNGKLRRKNGTTAFRGQNHLPNGKGAANRDGRDMKEIGVGATRNKRTVWTVATSPFKGAHFATFPPQLIEPCIKAGCPHGGIVLDPFGGSGTTEEVAVKLGRKAILLELNPEYVKLRNKRMSNVALLEMAAETESKSA